MNSRTMVLAIACLAFAITLIAAVSGSASNDASSTTVQSSPSALPTGPMGDSIRYGRQIVERTQETMKANVGARLSCSACHLNAGTLARGGSFVGLYGRFPQWNARSHRVIALQDRITECFLRSMNGTPPAYSSKEMIAIVAYIAWLSRDVPVGTPAAKESVFIEPLPSASPDLAHGAKLYASTCTACHQADGNGVGDVFPPLWGVQSFNSGAGMARLDRMTGFVHYNMPQNARGSLSLQDSYDVSAFVLSHSRPNFDGAKLVSASPEPASSF